MSGEWADVRPRLAALGAVGAESSSGWVLEPPLTAGELGQERRGIMVALAVTPAR